MRPGEKLENDTGQRKPQYNAVGRAWELATCAEPTNETGWETLYSLGCEPHLL